jgi:phosphoribosylanthranilate isomerase
MMTPARDISVTAIKPDFITFTGADDGTRTEELLAFADRHPKTEFGILLSASRAGSSRYPTLSWIRNVPRSLHLAAHVCGSWAAALAERGEQAEVEALIGGFRRVQINVGRVPQDLGPLASFASRLGVEVILQSRDGNAFPADNRISWLFDASGGAGIVPTSWPRHHEKRLVGYAGGLGPSNAAQVVAGLDATGPYWIDMESRVRNTDDAFDLSLCDQVSRAVGL